MHKENKMKPVIANRLDKKSPVLPMEAIVEEDWEKEFTQEHEIKKVNTLVDAKFKK